MTVAYGLNVRYWDVRKRAPRIEGKDPMARLLLVPSLRYGGAASQARNLARAFREEGQEVHVVVIGSSGPWQTDLQDAGVSVHVLNWSRSVELTPLWRLNALLKEIRPTGIDAFGLCALRVLATAGASHLSLTWVHRLALDLQEAAPADKLLLHCIAGVVATTRWEASLVERFGIRGDRIKVHRPAMADEGFQRSCRQSMSKDEGVASGEAILSVARLERRHNPRDAMWTMDMLAYAFSDCRLTLVGEGSLADELHELQGKIYYPGRTTIIPSVPDAVSLYSPGNIGWILAKPGHGLQSAIEAQSRGCPIVAYDQPALRELMRDGETGFLVPQGDMVGLARQTFKLFRDQGLHSAMSETGRQWARDQFARPSVTTIAHRISA